MIHCTIIQLSPEDESTRDSYFIVPFKKETVMKCRLFLSRWCLFVWFRFIFVATSKVWTHQGTGSRNQRSEVVTSGVGKHPRLQQTRCLGYSLVLLGDEQGSGIYNFNIITPPAAAWLEAAKVGMFPICKEEHSYYCQLLLHWRPHQQTSWSEPVYYLIQCVY